jgi:hypothetical protein
MIYKVYNHNGTCLGVFNNKKEAEACASEYRYQTENAAYVEVLK